MGQVERDPRRPIGPVLELEAADGAERQARDHRLGAEARFVVGMPGT